MPALAPVLRLFFGELMAEMRAVTRQGGGRGPVMLLIDEFQALGRMSYLERAIHTVAADGVSVAMIAQSVAALDALYGREGREAFESAAGVRLFIAPRDPRTAREVSAIVGKTTREAVTRNWGRTRELFGGARSHTARLEERPLLSETEARMLDPERVVIVAGSQQPILANRVKYYEDRAFGDAVAAARSLPLPWPEPRPERQVELAEPCELDGVLAEKDRHRVAEADAPGPAMSSTPEEDHGEPVAQALRAGADQRMTSERVMTDRVPNLRRSRLRATGSNLAHTRPALPEQVEVDAEAPATWNDVLK
jgi:type IV secretory pathway TraG/TraD family ATPase VirD4